jgi:hypothetical protein
MSRLCEAQWGLWRVGCAEIEAFQRLSDGAKVA